MDLSLPGFVLRIAVLVWRRCRALLTRASARIDTLSPQMSWEMIWTFSAGIDPDTTEFAFFRLLQDVPAPVHGIRK